MSLIRRQKHRDLGMVLLGSGRPSFVYNKITVPFRNVRWAFYRPFHYTVFSLLLNDSLDLQWHKQTFFDPLPISKTDATVLGVTITVTEIVLGHDLTCCLLVHIRHLLKLLGRLMAFLFWTMLFRKRGLLRRRRVYIRALMLLYTHSQSNSISSCGSSQLSLVITSVTDRRTCAHASSL